MRDAVYWSAKVRGAKSAMKQVWGNGEHATALTVAEMRAADAYTIAHFTPGRELMRRAAEGVNAFCMYWCDLKRNRFDSCNVCDTGSFV